jgi:type IV pilus assembly protein PilB
LDGKTLDVRVSIVPVVNGENVVMRLLADNQRGFGISNLGLSEKNLGLIREALKKPHGMILTTGPTGCGKTTTLYEFLKLLNAPEVHIATIEDPVEYDIEGVSQIQVNTATNLTFAKGLRAIVRQDPDVIMVGEIRDEETASIAVNSAMTGHLVLSTLHTNDASTAAPRLLDMGVEPFLIASTLEIILAQRLVRKICEKCRASYQFGEEERVMIENEHDLRDALRRKNKNLSKLTFFKGEGCRMCGHTGFRGRIGIFEIWSANQKARDLIMAKASRDEISHEAKKAGMVTMFEDGLEKVFSGLTTLAEVIRVTKEE